MENRNGLLVDACLTRANGHAERIAALHMIEPRADRAQAITVDGRTSDTPDTPSASASANGSRKPSAG
jgi:hypothetical protein